MALRTGGARKDRVFKLHVKLPDDVCEDLVMDMFEDALCERIQAVRKWFPNDPRGKIDTDTVCVKRRTPKYKEQS